MQLFIFGDILLDEIHYVDALPREGECRIIKTANVFYGGRGANIAVAARKLGLNAALFSIAGRNFSSSGYEAYLRENQVNIENVKLVQEEMSRFLLYTTTDKSYAFYNPRVDHYYDALPFNIDILKGCEMVHFTLMHEKFCARVLKQLKNVKLKNVNMNWIISASLGKEIYLASKRYLSLLLRVCNYLFMNEAEAKALTAKVGAEMKELLQNENLRAMAITSGEKGSIIQTSKRVIRIPAVKVKRARNPVGAGDAYAAGFLFGLSRNYDLLTCGRIASVVASYAVEGFGAQSSLPNINQVRYRYLKAFGAPFH
ncbi:MAG: PfkB family carbohydrate kinase [Methanocellales archaeon]